MYILINWHLLQLPRAISLLACINIPQKTKYI